MSKCVAKCGDDEFKIDTTVRCKKCNDKTDGIENCDKCDNGKKCTLCKTTGDKLFLKSDGLACLKNCSE